MAADYDVLIATDLRACGADVGESIAQEVEVQARLGLRTGLIHIGGKAARGTRWALALRRLVIAGLAEPVSPYDEVRASLLVLRGPHCFSGKWHLGARADKTLLVADECPDDATGYGRAYEVKGVRERMEMHLGGEPEWVAVGEVVRESLAAYVAEGLPLSNDLWRDVFNTEGWRTRPPGESLRRGVIGRLGVDDYRAWPENPDELERAYPRDGSHLVRLLGGVAAARNIVDSRAREWHAFRAGSIPRHLFLADLDVYVHFHHSQLRASSPRGLLEALAAGLPAITHQYLEAELGPSCVYGETADAPKLVASVLANPASRPNSVGVQWVRERHDWRAHRQRLSRYLGKALPELSRPGKRKKRILFMSSNGTGMGHLTRLLAIARRLPDDCEPLFLTLSAGLRAIREFQMWCDFAPSSGAASIDGAYHQMLRERVGAALEALRPDALVFDGTFPYKGLRQALGDYPEVTAIWSRRGMWKPVEDEVAWRSLQHAATFSHIIEPGDFADEDDVGATSRVRDSTELVEPVILLDDSEIKDRDAARAELGIREDETAVLLNLGAGNINRIDGLAETIARVLLQHADVRLFVLKSLIANEAFEAGAAKVSGIEMYPLARVLKAFDACIAAPGYNSFHELLSYAIPTVFIPNEDTLLDNQLVRAQWAARVGAALIARESALDEIEPTLERLLDAEVRASLRERCAQLPSRRGGQQAADVIASAVAERKRSFRVLDIARPTLSKRLYRAGRWIYRRSRQVAAGSMAVVRLLRRDSPSRVLPRLPSDGLPESRILLDLEGAAEDSLEAITQWATGQSGEVIAVAPAPLLPALHRSGLRVELVTSLESGRSIEERLEFAEYHLRKMSVVKAAFHCRDAFRWEDVGQGRGPHL